MSALRNRTLIPEQLNKKYCNKFRVNFGLVELVNGRVVLALLQPVEIVPPLTEFS